MLAAGWPCHPSGIPRISARVTRAVDGPLERSPMDLGPGEGPRKGPSLASTDFCQSPIVSTILLFRGSIRNNYEYEWLGTNHANRKNHDSICSGQFSRQKMDHIATYCPATLCGSHVGESVTGSKIGRETSIDG